jgi:hypothetical protein
MITTIGMPAFKASANGAAASGGRSVLADHHREAT